MTIRVALHHQTRYRFDRPVAVMPHEVRLCPANHARTPISRYSLRIEPAEHFINWQQDPYGNWLARLVFPEEAEALTVTVDLVADMTVINPFDFFVESYAERFPFAYAPQLEKELHPFLESDESGPLFTQWKARAQADFGAQQLPIIDFLVSLNQRLQQDINYIVRMEHGVQTPEETLEKRLGSCRDSAWLLVHILRQLGLAARFVSGYLIQLTADVKALDGPSGPEADFTDLHAWTEVYIPGAGWVGLDPTSGLLTGEGHIPLASTAAPSSAAPVIGATGICKSEMDVTMTVTRIHEDPRVTKPYSQTQWQGIEKLGAQVEQQLLADDVRLTMGGEPTFVSLDDMDGDEWNIAALSDKKRELAGDLLLRLKKRFADGGLLHFGQGKWYPGEPLPRWALACYWREDGEPLWHTPSLLEGHAQETSYKTADAETFSETLCEQLGLSSRHVIVAYEDVAHAIFQEQGWPNNLDPLEADLDDADERRRLARLISQDLREPAGFVLPLKPIDRVGEKKNAPAEWRSSVWPLRREHLYLMPGDSPLGLRLPLASLPWVLPEDYEDDFPRDPFDDREPLSKTAARHKSKKKPLTEDVAPREVIHTALCLEVRDGMLHVFLPPLSYLEDFVDLVASLEATARELAMPIRLEGYEPPSDPRLNVFKITPDPGVIEVNIHPASNWQELVKNTYAIYEEARQSRLIAEKFMLDGRHTGTGGGNHVTIGAAIPADSPCLRRPDLLMSLITYWQNHPALSYLFSGMFIGPTSQAPRLDEARHESLYELEIAFQQMQQHLNIGEESVEPWLVDRLLRHLLIDVSGNTHRAEFCIDKLYSPDSATGRLGLLEFRSFEMPPHPEMSLLQMLLLRALIVRFWREPYQGRLVRWGTELHDHFMLPYYIEQDMRDVVRDLQKAGYVFEFEWFLPFFEFRFPRYGAVVYDNVEIELRQAIEPWHVLGEEVHAGGTSRYVDSSVERLQVRVRGLNKARYVVTCNGRPLPLADTNTRGEYVAGVRYRAWHPPSALHPTIGVQSPLVFDVLDTWNNRSVGGCTYHVAHPGGRSYETFPVNSNEAEARRFARFSAHGHTPGKMTLQREGLNPDYPMTLDLRREPEIWDGGSAPRSTQEQAQQAQQ